MNDCAPEGEPLFFGFSPLASCGTVDVPALLRGAVNQVSGVLDGGVASAALAVGLSVLALLLGWRVARRFTA